MFAGVATHAARARKRLDRQLPSRGIDLCARWERRALRACYGPALSAPGFTTAFHASATLTLKADRPREFTISMRRPYWVGEGFAVTVNGTPVTTETPMDDQKVRRTRRTQ